MHATRTLLGMKHRLGGVALALVTALGAFFATPPPPVAADTPVLGGQLFSTGEAVEIEVLAASAGLTSTLFLLEPEEVRIATNRDIGTVVTVGPYGIGEELIFGIRVSGQEYRMGPAERNPDGVIHATVEFLADGCAIVGFEDLFGGGDRDYNDNRFQFCGGIASEPPDPEPPPAPPPFVPPVADAGDDQSVPEGSVVTLDGTRSTASSLVSRTYTTSGDFAEGTSINLTDTPPDQLQLDDTTEAFAFIWIAASARGTVVKIDTETGVILGEYWSAPQNRAKDPSRTTVDHNGNVWVGNRAEASSVGGAPRGSATQIGLAENGQCVDRNGNGVIDTSGGLGDIKAWPNTSGVDTDGGVETAADECVITYVRTNGVAIRQVSVDADNHVWVGGAAQGGSPSMFDRLAPDGSIVRTINMRSNAHTGESGVVVCCYGGLVDPAGVLWSSSGSNTLVRIDPSKPNGHADLVRITGLGRTSYGLGIDPDGFLWQSNWTANTVQKISPAGALLNTYPTGGASSDRGVAVTADGDVWVANSGGSSVSRLRNDGTVLAVIGVGQQPTGVAVDAAGKVWATNLSSSTASRIDPATNVVDLTVSLGAGAGPYNYSDMTGSTLTGAPDEGTWSVVYDSEAADTAWAFVDWSADVAGDGSLDITVASSADGETFTPDVAVNDGEAIAGLADGRYLRVTARFNRSTAGASPVLFDLTVAHEGDRANTLGYHWRLTDIDGPPIFLSSTTSPTPSFVAPDDATYTFELTVTDSAGLSDTDETTVTVANEAPELTVESTQGVAGTLTLVSTSFTDPGWLDSHSGTIDWGDGSTGDLRVTDGTGWGTAFSSHRYAEPGSYSVALTLTDDDGGVSTAATATVDIAEAVAIWANSSTAADTIDWSGSGVEVRGRAHSNMDVKLSGSDNTVDGSLEYVGAFADGGGGNTYDPPARVPVEDFPITFDIADYQPGGSAAVAAGDQYFDMSAECSSRGKFERDVQATELPMGLYYAPCDVVFNASNLVGTFTIVSTGNVEVSGSDESLAQPFIDGLLMFTTSTSDDAVKLSGSNSGYSGFVYAPNGRLEVAGSTSRFFCGMFADRIRLTGSDNEIAGGGCSEPAQDTGGTLLVPSIGLDLSADVTDALPSEPITYDLAVSNDGSTLVVTGLLGAENVDDQAWPVTGFRWALETFDVATGAWGELASADPGGSTGVSLSVQANESAGVSYGADPFMATSLEPMGFASWSYEAAVPLAPGAVTDLLDPTVTGGIRVRFDLDFGDPSARVRQLFRFGSDFIDPLRALSGDITDTSLTLLLPTGDPVLVDATVDPSLASLAPGDSTDLEEIYTVEVPAARGATETDAGYLSRLLILDGAPLVGSAFALGQGGVGRLVAPLVTATTTEHLPVVSISTVGPDDIPAGTTAAYDLNVANLGSSRAPSVEVAASAAGSALDVADAPADLVAGQLATATTSYAAPSDNPPADVTVTGEVTWTDDAGNDYGPVRSARTTPILTAATLSATLVDTLQTDVGGDGQVSPGDTVRYTIAIANRGDQPLTDVVGSVTPDANSALVVGSVTVAGGTVVSGNAAGDTGVEVTLASVAGDSTAAATFDVTVDDPFPSGITRLDVQGEASADGFEPIPTDDPALPGAADRTRTTVVVPVPNLTAFLSARLHLDPDGNGFASAGDTIRYDLNVNSVGSLAVTGVDVSVPTPSGTSLVAGTVTTTAGTINAGSTVGVALGSMPSFTSASIGFDLLIASPIPAGMTAVSVQGSVASNELEDLATDDPNTFTVGDPTVTAIGSGPGGGPGGGTPGVPGPTIGEVSLAEGTVITEPTEVSATLAPPDGETVTAWTVGYRLEGDTSSTQIASGAGENLAATLDPTVMPNGSYVLVLTATGSAGGVSVAESSFVVEGNLKLGRFQVTYQDLNVPVGGIPLQVLRTYDSFDKSNGDFGVGWSLELANFRVSTNGPLGQGGWTMFGCGGGLIFVPLCFSSTTPHYVTVTWPDGRVETFDLTPARGSTFLRGLTSAQFTARPGTTSTLQALDSGLYWSNGDLLGGFFGSNGIYDPTRFRLTDRFGTQYQLEVGRGLLSATDRNGNTVTVSNTGVRSSLGPSITFTRDAQGRITQVEGPNDAALSYAYDAAGDLVSVVDAKDRSTAFAYAAHQLTDIVDAAGRPFRQLEYGSDGRLAAVVDALGNRTEIDVNVSQRREIITDAGGRLTTISTFDERGNALTINEVFDGVDHGTTYTYDERDNLLSRADPLGNAWSLSYDAAGNPVSTTDPLGNETTFIYNAFGQVASHTDAMGAVTSLEYDDQGNLAAVTDPEGGIQEFEYDHSGNRTSHTDQLGNVTSWAYDAAGRVTSITDPLLRQTTFAYDAAGRLLGRTDALGRETTATYDEVGQVTSFTDGNGHTATYAYDTADQLVTMTDALGGSVEFGYDLAGRLVSVTDANDATRDFTYDANGRLLTEEDPVGGTTTYEYDGGGRLTARIDARDVDVSYARDLAGRVTGVTAPDATIEFGYDPVGQRVAMTDATGTTTWDYDPMGRVIEVAAPAGVIDYTYDAMGRRSSMSLPAGTVTYGYDAAGRLQEIHDWLTQSTSYEWDAASQLALITRANGVATEFAYDAAGNQTEITHSGPAGELESFASTYDDANNRTAVTSSAGMEAYTLDALDRLTQVSYPDGTAVSYTYDAAGNRISKSEGADTTGYTYDPAGRLIAIETGGAVQNLTYDAAGNQTANGSRAFTWDSFGRLASATDGSSSASYTYDGDGLRVGQDGDGQPTSYLWDRALAVPVIVSDGGSSFLQAAGLVSPGGSAASEHLLSDALGSIRLVTDANGTVTATASYDAFGEVQSVSGTSPPFGYAGEVTDASGLTYLRARYHDPAVGRFLSEDPLQPNAPGTQGWNLYAYVMNNPTSHVDPLGRAAFGEYFSLQAAKYGFVVGFWTRSAEGLRECSQRHEVGDQDWLKCMLYFGLAGGATGFVFGGFGPAVSNVFIGIGACLTGGTLSYAEDEAFAASVNEQRTGTDRALSIGVGCLMGILTSGGGPPLGGAPARIPQPVPARGW